MSLKVVFLLVISWCAVVFTLLQVRKCCPHHQQLHIDYGECVERNSSTSIKSNRDDHWPWWFPSERKLLTQSSGKTVDSFPYTSFVSMPGAAPCSEQDTLFLYSNSIDHHYDFINDGSLRVHFYIDSRPVRNLTFPPLSYCVDRLYDPNFPLADEFMVHLCPCSFVACVLKCCEFGQLLSFSSNRNISENNCIQGQLGTRQLDELDNYIVLNRLPVCAQDEQVALSTDLDSSIWKQDHSLKFCIEQVYDQLTNTSTSQLFRCSRRDGLNLTDLLYGTLSILGAVFLGLTLIAYALLPRKLTVNDKNLIAQTASLLVGYAGLSIARLALHQVPHFLCVSLGFIILYGFLASFFWLNVLCIDLAWTFSELRLIRSVSRRRFVQYSLYAWLSPTAIVVVALIADFISNPSNKILQPQFFIRCWFANDSTSKWVYFYGPIAVLLGTNILLFLYTAYKIQDAQKQASSLLRNNAKQERQRVILYVKLFCFMGLSWVFELISWRVGGADYYWYFTDMINLLRAIFIFATICWKKEVWDGLVKKWPRGSTSAVTLPSPRTPSTNLTESPL